jgi:hypothetical protein
MYLRDVDHVQASPCPVARALLRTQASLTKELSVTKLLLCLCLFAVCSVGGGVTPALAAPASTAGEWQRVFVVLPKKTYDVKGEYTGRRVGFLERKLITSYDYLWQRTAHNWTYRLIPHYTK